MEALAIYGLPSTGCFGFNTNILATNPINLNAILSVLIFFGKGVSLQGALGTLTSCLNNKLHLHSISANIGMFAVMKEIID
ncbi:hypothetical protein NMG60_11001080 [Bertholletia excelsa]